jgi:hypothetical protein
MAGLIRRLASLGFVLALTVVIGAPTASGYVRPKSGSPIKVALVPAFVGCAPPANRQHGPPLAVPSCNPPTLASTAVTTGTPTTSSDIPNLVGRFSMVVQAGTPGPPDDADLHFQGMVTDVRCQAATSACGSANAEGGDDYTGQLQGSFQVRITDRWNAVSPGGGPDPATVVDLPIPATFSCVTTASTAEGGSCTATTSLDALVANAVREGKRSVYETSQVEVNDGGSDGNIFTTPNTNFLRQGVFVP